MTRDAVAGSDGYEAFLDAKCHRVALEIEGLLRQIARTHSEKILNQAIEILESPRLVRRLRGWRLWSTKEPDSHES